VQSSYDTDIFKPLIREIELITKASYGNSDKQDIAIRVIADHIRAVAFAIADGQLPGNTGAGYVIRRILRRAIRYGFTFLDTREPFIYRLVRILASDMGPAFPELKDQKQLIENVIQEEEHSFLRTLEQGLVLLDATIASSKSKTIDGKKAFELYDTFGFPIDLTSLILNEKGYNLDEEGFEQAMREQKERSRKASEVSREDWVVLREDADPRFVGYDILQTEAAILKYRKIKSKKEGDQFQIVLNTTPFYPEGGGQVGDKGYLEAPDGDVVYILDTRRENNEIIHISNSLPKDPKDTFRAVVDEKQRLRTACNHTATHLLQQALRDVLGPHVEQKGSAVHANYLRFDFSHFAKLTEKELQAVETFVNARIADQLPLEEQRMIPMKQALEEGAIALFGEKYGENVRTVRFGKSLELCGGTHVKNTSEIWHFKITSESAIAAGVRRIEAITSDAVKAYFEESEQLLNEVRSLLKGNQDPKLAIKVMQEENSRLKKELEILQKQKAIHLKKQLLGEIEIIDEVRFLAKKVDLDASGQKDLSFEMGQATDNLFLLLASEQGGKAVLSCYISKPLAGRLDLNAGAIVRELGKHIHGGGGGQPFFATAGGSYPQGIPTALEKAREYIHPS
jgi:alanyl-tRNA synthetase